MDHDATAAIDLPELGARASLAYDDLTAGWILSIDDAEQSHVDLAHPQRVFYEYLARITHVVEQLPRCERVLHVGGGALTLPRYLAAVGDPQQVVVDIAADLPGFVIEHLPLPPGARVETIIGDAAAVTGDLASSGAHAFDLVVVDLHSGPQDPAHLCAPAFFADLQSLLRPEGVLIVNAGDDPGLTHAAALARTLRSTARPGDALWCATEASMLSRKRAGNLILFTVPGVFGHQWYEPLLAAGPHPAAVLDDDELRRFLGD